MGIQMFPLYTVYMVVISDFGAYIGHIICEILGNNSANIATFYCAIR